MRNQNRTGSGRFRSGLVPDSTLITVEQQRADPKGQKNNKKSDSKPVSPVPESELTVLLLKNKKSKQDRFGPVSVQFGAGCWSVQFRFMKPDPDLTRWFEPELWSCLGRGGGRKEVIN